MKRSKLIVLSGVAGAGKDSVADILVEHFGWQLYSLAGPMKRFVHDMFGFTKEQLYGPSSARNAPDIRWARPCPNCDALGLVTCRQTGETNPCLDCVNGKINDNSPRRVLQLLGEEYLRQMIHVDALTLRARPDLEKMLEQGHRVVINDARNDNDRNNLYMWLNATRVDVRSIRKKEMKPAEKWRQHLSECRPAEDTHIEYVVQNDEKWPFPSLRSTIGVMLEKLDLIL